jgi:hypothetical protein
MIKKKHPSPIEKDDKKKIETTQEKGYKEEVMINNIRQ